LLIYSGMEKNWEWD